MSQEQNTEKKNRFQISREVQEDFVNSVAENMLSLAAKAGQWEKPWTGASPMGMPFCATTGREYGGANMVKLMLTSIVNNYNDDRWMTFKQLQQFQGEHPALDVKIQKGQKGIKLLRPEELKFIIKDDGKWEYLNEKQIKDIAAQKAQGYDVPDVQRMTLFYPFTVFNASQMEGFPPKEHESHGMTYIERNDLVERYIACSGISVEHHNGDAYYNPEADSVKMPFAENFTGTEEYYATKLHESYHATGHAGRENRKEKQFHNLKNHAFEEMRAEMFSMLAGAHFDLPMPESNSAAYIAHWNQKFSGGESKAVFQAAAEAAKVLTIMHQFEMGEQPKAQWFPPSEQWPDLMAAQAERDAVTGTHVPTLQENTAAKNTATPQERPTPLSFAEATQALAAATEPEVKGRIILQSPELLDIALKQDPESTRTVEDVCIAFPELIRQAEAPPLAPTGTETLRMRI